MRVIKTFSIYLKIQRKITRKKSPGKYRHVFSVDYILLLIYTQKLSLAKDCNYGK